MIDECFANLAKKARDNNPPALGDYTDDNGILHCGTCGDPKEAVIEGMKVACACKCSRNARDKAEEEKRRSAYDERRKLCFSAPVLAKSRIENADNCKAAQIIRRYISKWDTVKAENYGLILWGGVGTGKSFLSACIANAVIDIGDTARMRTAGEIILEAQDAANKAQYFNDLCSKSLLIIDDLGTERDTAFGSEVIYTLIDKRYQTGKPMIVTTNIPLQDLKNTVDAGKSRLYDRILEVCVPVKVDGSSRRKIKAADRLQAARTLLDA